MTDWYEPSQWKVDGIANVPGIYTWIPNRRFTNLVKPYHRSKNPFEISIYIMVNIATIELVGGQREWGSVDIAYTV